MTKVNFEGIAPHDSTASIPPGYDDISWSGAEVADKAWIKHNFTGPNGFASVLHGKGAAYATDDLGFTEVHLTQVDHHLTIRSGTFAVLGGEPEWVVFNAYHPGHGIAHMAVLIGVDGTTVHFDETFSNVTQLEITTDPAKGGSGGLIVFDNLRVNQDIPPADDPHAAAADAMALHDVVHGHIGATGEAHGGWSALA